MLTLVSSRIIGEECSLGPDGTLRRASAKMETFGEQEVSDRVLSLVAEYRNRCLWFLREDFVPRDGDEAIRVLENIEKHSDRKGFVEARRLKTWLLQNSSVESAS